MTFLDRLFPSETPKASGIVYVIPEAFWAPEQRKGCVRMLREGNSSEGSLEVQIDFSAFDRIDHGAYPGLGI